MSRSEVLEQSAAVTARVLASPTYQSARSISVYVSMASGEVDTDELCRQTIALGKKLYVPLFATPTAASSSSSSSLGTAAVSDPQPAKIATTMSKDMRMLRLCDLTEYEGMKENRWGIREPEDWIEETGMSGQRKPREDGESAADQPNDAFPSSHHAHNDFFRLAALEEPTGGDGLDLILAPGVAFDQEAGRLGHGKGYYDRYLSRCEGWAASRGCKGPVCIALGLSPQVLPPGESVPRDEFDRVLDAIVTPGGVLRSPSDAGRWADGVGSSTKQ